MSQFELDTLLGISDSHGIGEIQTGDFASAIIGTGKYSWEY